MGRAGRALPARRSRCTTRTSRARSPCATCWCTAAASGSAPATCSGGRRRPTTAKEIVRRLRYIPPATTFRSAYAYDNVLYLVAGAADRGGDGPDVGGLRRTRASSAPVGMTGSTCGHRPPTRGGNVATPHARVDGTVRPVAPFDERQHEPRRRASTPAPSDMAKWMIVQLDSGRGWPTARGSFSAATRARAVDASSRRSRSASPPPELAPLRPELPRLRARLRRPRLPRPQGRCTHTGGLPRLRLAGGDDSRPAARRRGAHQPGVGRGVRRDRVPRARPLPRRAGARLGRRAIAKVEPRRRERGTATERGRARAARDATSRPSLPLARYAGTLPRRLVRRRARSRTRGAGW